MSHSSTLTPSITPELTATLRRLKLDAQADGPHVALHQFVEAPRLLAGLGGHLQQQRLVGENVLELGD